MLSRLGVIRYDDLADFTVTPHRIVRDCSASASSASDAPSMTAAAKAARKAVLASIGGNGQNVVLHNVAPVQFGSDHLSQFTIAVGARAWLMRRLWVEGTGGPALASAAWRPVTSYTCYGGSGEDDSYTSACSPDSLKGLSASGSVGLEVLSFRSFALSARGRVDTGIYRDLRLMTATVGANADVFF